MSSLSGASILTLWVPAYDIEGLTKGFLALISVGITAALLSLSSRAFGIFSDLCERESRRDMASGE
jgi:hypothetical protein